MKLISILFLIPAPCLVAQLPAERVAEIRQLAAQQGESEAQTAILIAREEAKLRDEQVSNLRRLMTEPWTSLKVGFRYLCSCTGPYSDGFEISKQDGSLSIASWSEGFNKEGPGEKRPLGEPAAERLFSEIVLHYLVAVTSVHPLEVAGPMPHDPEEQIKWLDTHLPVGGDRYFIEINFTTPDGGVATIVNQYASHPPQEFLAWISFYYRGRAN